MNGPSLVNVRQIIEIHIFWKETPDNPMYLYHMNVLYESILILYTGILIIECPNIFLFFLAEFLDLFSNVLCNHVNFGVNVKHF